MLGIPGDSPHFDLPVGFFGRNRVVKDHRMTVVKNQHIEALANYRDNMHQEFSPLQNARGGIILLIVIPGAIMYGIECSLVNQINYTHNKAYHS